MFLHPGRVHPSFFMDGAARENWSCGRCPGPSASPVIAQLSALQHIRAGDVRLALEVIPDLAAAKQRAGSSRGSRPATMPVIARVVHYRRQCLALYLVLGNRAGDRLVHEPLPTACSRPPPMAVSLIAIKAPTGHVGSSAPRTHSEKLERGSQGELGGRKMWGGLSDRRYSCVPTNYPSQAVPVTIGPEEVILRVAYKQEAASGLAKARLRRNSDAGLKAWLVIVLETRTGCRRRYRTPGCRAGACLRARRPGQRVDELRRGHGRSRW